MKNKILSTNISCIFDKERENLLLACGLDRLVLANKRHNYNLEENVASFKPSVSGVKTRNIGEPKQLDYYNRIMLNPLKGNGTYVLNSFPTDLRAKQLAAVIMNKSITDHNDISNKFRKGRNLPMWIKLVGYGGPDLIKQIREVNPCALFISNINDESTPHKIEKLRDILEVFDNIPKYIITAGQDPLTFFARKLFYPVSGAIRVGSANKVSNILEMM
jgi:hypothetical protein